MRITLRHGAVSLSGSFRDAAYLRAIVIDDLRRAGGQWRSHAKAHETELQGWDAETYKEWMGMVRRGEGTEAGLGVS